MLAKSVPTCRESAGECPKPKGLAPRNLERWKPKGNWRARVSGLKPVKFMPGVSVLKPGELARWSLECQFPTVPDAFRTFWVLTLASLRAGGSCTGPIAI